MAAATEGDLGAASDLLERATEQLDASRFAAEAQAGEGAKVTARLGALLAGARASTVGLRERR